MPNNIDTNDDATVSVVSQFANRGERTSAFYAEQIALSAWTAKKGRKGPRPATPAHDEISKGIKFGRKSNGAHASKSTIVLARNGKTLAASWNKFSNVAYHMTKGMAADGGPRMSTTEFASFVSIQTGVPVEAVTTTSWTVTLASGDVITATVPGAPAVKARTSRAPRGTSSPRTTRGTKKAA